MQTQILFQENQIEDLSRLIKDQGIKKIFLVRGGESYINSGAESFIKKLVGDIEIVSFSEFDVNPNVVDLRKGVNKYNSNQFDLIIGIGGGSVLDMAKLISVFANQSNDFEDIIKNNSIEEEIKTPLLAIPTTAGTGAEATHFAVVYIGKNKYSVAAESILPDYVYLSSAFSLSANPYLTACTGLDAFSQAIESVWSVSATDESIEYALKSIKLIWNSLAKAVNNNDKEAKLAMQEASYLAGKAINITKTTAPHAISYTFTSYYDIPHGHAVSLSLPYFIRYNYNLDEEDCTDNRGFISVKNRIDNVLNILDLNIMEVEGALIKFFEVLGIEININKLIQKFDKELIISNVNTERLNNNPRIVTKETLNLFIEKSIKY